MTTDLKRGALNHPSELSAIMDTVSRPCPGLNKDHGFLLNIRKKLSKSQEELTGTDKIRANKNQNNTRERRTRPTLQLYCIPAKRGQSKDRGNLFFEDESDIRRPPEVEETSGKPRLKSQIEKDPSQPDLRKAIHSIRKNKIKSTTGIVSPENHSPLVSSDLSDVKIEAEDKFTDYTDFISTYKIDHFHTVDIENRGFKSRCKESEKLDYGRTKKSDMLNPTRTSFENSVAQELLSRSQPKNSEKVVSGKLSSDLAEQTLIKLLSRAKPQELNEHNGCDRKWTVGDSCLVADTISDPCSVADESLNRVAMAIVSNSLNSEISSFRMRRVAMVIMQKEKGLTKSSQKMRFVHALLAACQMEAAHCFSEPLPSHDPFVSFVSLLYCCDTVRQSVLQAWAELLLSLFTTYLHSMTTALEAEKLFSLLQTTGAQLEKDIPGGLTELRQAVKTIFLCENMDNKIKDILFDIIEVKAGGWKHT